MKSHRFWISKRNNQYLDNELTRKNKLIRDIIEAWTAEGNQISDYDRSRKIRQPKRRKCNNKQDEDTSALSENRLIPSWEEL